MGRCRGRLAAGLVRDALHHYCLGGCSALLVCARRSRQGRGVGLVPVLVFLSSPSRSSRCVWWVAPFGCPLPSPAGTPFQVVCAFRELGPVALLVRAACPLCVGALALPRCSPPPPPHGGCSWSGPDPKGGRGGTPPPYTDPKIVVRNNVLCLRQRRRRFCFRHTAWGIFFVRPDVSVLKIRRILRRIHKWLKNTKKDFDPNPASGSDLG